MNNWILTINKTSLWFNLPFDTGQCLPGTFSEDALEPCETCPLGQFQSVYASSECEQCPSNMTTLRPGSRREDDCQVMCLQGHISRTGVEPCYPCPRGYFQPERGKVACFMCPNATETLTKAATDISQCIGWYWSELLMYMWCIFHHFSKIYSQQFIIIL